LTVKRDSVGDWFITISCDLEDDFIPEKMASMTGKSAGFDFGLKSFLTSSDGEKHDSNEYLKTHLKELKIKGRNLSRKERGSKNRKKARKSLARVHRKIANKRMDSHFKLALDLVRSYDHLFFEDLNLQGMQMPWGRKVSDYGFSDFLKILENKVFEHKKNLHKIDRFFPSSKLCAQCGKLKENDELTLKNRIYKCPCGNEVDRDLNAAINILKEGASSLGLDGVIPDLGLVCVA
jgi:putative transposase